MARPLTYVLLAESTVTLIHEDHRGDARPKSIRDAFTRVYATGATARLV